MKNMPLQHSITIVTVTYGNRWELVRQLLAYALMTQKVSDIVLVNNGSAYDLRAKINSEFGDRKLHLLDSASNKGSAWGFKVGIAKALNLNANYMLLLDDDNVPEPGCIDNLLAAIGDYPEFSAIAAHRPSITRQTLALQGIERICVKSNSFAGFDFTEFFPRLLRKIRQLKKTEYALKKDALIEVAPYGGFFASKSVIKRMGFPNEDYYLYGDDNDFTYRLTKMGGGIWLRSDCLVKDVDQSWGTQDYVHHYFILDAPEFRLRGTVENIARFEVQQGFGGIRYLINGSLFLAIHTLKSIAHYRSVCPVIARNVILLRYIREGRAKGRFT